MNLLWPNRLSPKHPTWQQACDIPATMLLEPRHDQNLTDPIERAGMRRSYESENDYFLRPKLKRFFMLPPYEADSTSRPD